MEDFLKNFNFYFQAKNQQELNAKKCYQSVMQNIYPIVAKNSSHLPKK